MTVPSLHEVAALFPLAEEFCLQRGMDKDFSNGAIVALSGGADSVFLLIFASFLSEKHGFPLFAVHVNHGIRGEEAKRDEDFCRDLCSVYSVPLSVFYVNVPEEAEKTKESTEQAARRLRYNVFDEVLRQREGAVLLTAHTATDNLETVLFHLARGTGLRGLVGIPPRRGRILRPLLTQNAKSIRSALCADGVPYMHDSTNEDTAYTRNRIRQTLLPAFLSVHGEAERAVSRMCRQIAVDEDYLTQAADHFFDNEVDSRGRVRRDSLKRLHEAIFVRVLTRMYREAGGTSGAEHVHITAARALNSSSSIDGRIDFPDELSFCITKNHTFFTRKKQVLSEKKAVTPMYHVLTMGENILDDGCSLVFLTDRENDTKIKQLQKRYQFFYRMECPKELLNGTIYIRSRKEGDAYRYGGMLRRLKKLYNDKKLSLDVRARLPVFCDNDGIFWVPGFPVREPLTTSLKKIDNHLKIYAYYLTDGGENE